MEINSIGDDAISFNILYAAKPIDQSENNHSNNDNSDDNDDRTKIDV